MKYTIEADPEPGLVKIGWTQTIDGKPYGQHMRVRLPIDHLEPYLESLKSSFADTLAQLQFKDDE